MFKNFEVCQKMYAQYVDKNGHFFILIGVFFITQLAQYTYYRFREIVSKRKTMQGQKGQTLCHSSASLVTHLITPTSIYIPNSCLCPISVTLSLYQCQSYLQICNSIFPNLGSMHYIDILFRRFTVHTNKDYAGKNSVM